MAIKLETFKITGKSFIGYIGNNIGRLPLECGPTANVLLQKVGAMTDKIMTEDPASDNRNGKYRMYSSLNLKVKHDGKQILALIPPGLMRGAVIDRHAGPEKLGNVTIGTPPDLKIDFTAFNKINSRQYNIMWRAYGRPPTLPADIVTQAVCLRLSRYIWHIIRCKIILNSNGTLSVTATIEGSQFPSHKVFINGVQVGAQPQGPLSKIWVSDTRNSSFVQETSLLGEMLSEIL